ncbi:MAG: hypothetical protein E7058_00540 [Lentisphaerae bacterium]|nr:hypothetical protein [Lentisphaerota bacterium]
MYKFHADKWTWYFAAPPGEAPGTPEELMRNAEVIKDVASVKVFRRDGKFFKWEIPDESGWLKRLRYRLVSRSKREYDTLSAVIRQDVAATVPLGYGECGCQSVLVTGELTGYQSVLGFLCGIYEKGENIAPEFLQMWGRFIKKFLATGFYFPDFHCGNLLYNAETQKFALVDLYGVRKVFFDRKRRQKRMIFRQLKDAMPFLADEELAVVLRESGVMDMEAFLEYSVQAVREFLPRRLKYAAGATQLDRPDGKKWKFAQSQQWYLPEAAADKVWHNMLLCRFFGIPHLHLTRMPGGGVLEGEAGYGYAGNARSGYIMQRLAAAGLPPEDFSVVLNQKQMAVAVDRRLIDPE